MTRKWFKSQKIAITVIQSNKNIFLVNEKSKNIMSLRNVNKTLAKHCGKSKVA